MNNCEPPCGYWEPHQGPMQEQSVLLAVEPSLQPWVSVPDSAGLESPRQLTTCIWSASRVVPFTAQTFQCPCVWISLLPSPAGCFASCLDTDKTVCTYDVDVTELWKACTRCSSHCKWDGNDSVRDPMSHHLQSVFPGRLLTKLDLDLATETELGFASDHDSLQVLLGQSGLHLS